MTTYILYVLVFLILVFVIYISSNAVKEGIKARKNLSANKNSLESNIDIIEKIKEAKKMKEDNIISQNEFDKIKKKLLDK
tara:strand:+ start:200 stop:439 length:240 start_codon:yes stop_codon:yes gene_type:complete